MKRKEPTRLECDEFRRLIKDTEEREVKRYLIMAFKAFGDTHYEAAVVLAWAGVERYYNMVVDEIGEWYFVQNYQKENNSRKPLDLSIRIRSVAVQNSISDRTKLFNDFITQTKDPKTDKTEIKFQYELLQKLRNSVAHGRGNFCSSSKEVFDAIMPIRSLATKAVADERFSNKEKVLDFLEKADLPSELIDFNGFADHLPLTRDWASTCMKLSSDFLTDKEVKPDNIRKFINCVWQRLTPNDRTRVWEYYAHHALNCFQNKQYESRKPAIYSFLRLPPPSTILSVRDQFLEYYLDWLQNQIELAKKEADRLQADPGRSPDDYDRLATVIETLLRKIETDAPEHLKEKWNDVNNNWRT
jgi:hypothetical protein